MRDEIWKNGFPRTRRGAGSPMRPPAVCSKRTHWSVTCGSAWMSGYFTAGNAIVFGPSLTRVTPIMPRPR